MSNRIHPVLALLVAFLAAACTEPAKTVPSMPQTPVSEPATVAPPAPASTPAPAETATSPKGGAAAAADASPGKPSAPVKISFETTVEPQLALPIPVQVTVRPTAQVDRLEVRIGSSEGLKLARAAKPIPTAARNPGDTLTETVTVTPLTDGVHYLRVTVVTLQGTQERATVMVYPVQAGSAQLKPEGTVKITPEGERIIEMPAQESGN